MAQPESLEVGASVDHRTDAELVELLNQLDVPFLAGGAPVGRSSSVTPSVLLARLAASPEARLRLAAIPLLLRHPELAAHVERRRRY
jgi:hypothetical protein